ncbi:adenosylmethionine-8-amino-7-oxononanoate aminotransferase [Rhizobium sp. BK313]|uniref:aminotransferase class III-fold pyridoxal phosphate-dependent enzyme n=1 Tax=Rhizobium sp. BK313 TaxID=2587081 RepID=UPI00105C7190|nr:aminotransferase class III-fold pyridoxal phosphate-dependent enzyme [Rhizobium sp. BK313]MBB3458105.1 adenosylmethionine-8-amino-7-oxononanoate aminotransferase [Rhizobium sp. BK313]
MAYHFHSLTSPRGHEIDGPLMITKAKAATSLTQGNRYLEGMGGLWCASLGSRPSGWSILLLPRGRSLPPTYHIFNHRSNDPCADVFEQIAELSPIPGSKVFLVNSGSEANDTMVKLAWYYNVARGKPAKRKIISRKGPFTAAQS